MSMKSTVTTAVLLSLIWGGGQAQADQMFLKAAQYRPAQSEAVSVELLNGTFEKSQSAVRQDRLRDVRVVAGGAVTQPGNDSWRTQGLSSYLSFDAQSEGTYIVGVSTKPRVIEMTGAQFESYMAYEGLKDELSTFKSDDGRASVRERYSKHVRAYLQVGEARTDDFKTPLGHPLEIVLEENPYNLRFGKTVHFKVLLDGKPLADQVVKASYEGFHAHDSSGEHVTSYDVRTDADGKASFLLSNKAVWYISLINMRRVDDAKADYESNWATATFHVK